MIPPRLVRTVPAETSSRAEQWWQQACELHPTWAHVTLRDPINKQNFPITGALWKTCESGAQLADLVRAEELFWRGGVYIDSDFECFKPLDTLLRLEGFAAYEDDEFIPNAVMGFEPDHPAILKVLQLAIQRHERGTWEAGVGVTTEVFKDRTDMLLLPPASFYAVHWRTAHRKKLDSNTIRAQNPWAFGLHHYAHSWA